MPERKRRSRRAAPVPASAAASRRWAIDRRARRASPRPPPARAAARPAPRPRAAPRARGSDSAPRSRGQPPPRPAAPLLAAARPRPERSPAARGAAAPRPAPAGPPVARALRPRRRVLGLALLRGDALVDGVADERVHERERRLRPEQIETRERSRRRCDLPSFESGECCRLLPLGAVTEHGDGTSKSCTPPSAGAPSRKRPIGSRRRARPVRRRQRRSDRRDILGGKCAQQARAEAAGCRPSRDGRQARTPRRRRPELLLVRVQRPGDAQRVRPHDRCRGIGKQSRRASGCSSSIGRSVAKHADRHPFESARQVSQPAQRRRVGPLQVVDRERERSASPG